MSDLNSELNPTGNSQSVSPKHQHEALRLLAGGLDINEVARRLNRRPRVVLQHVAALLARLGVATPAEALARLGNASASQPEPDAVPDAGSPATGEAAVEPVAPAAAA